MLGVDFIENVVDDLDVNMDPDTYVDQASPAPPLPGNYRVVVKQAEQKKDKEGNVILVDAKFPIITLKQLEIIEPVENGRLFSPFHDIRTKPFERAVGVLVSEVADFTSSVDRTRGWSGLQEGLRLVDEYLDTQASFVINLGWEAFDKAYLEAQLEETGLKGVEKDARTDEQKKLLNFIYKKARLRTNAFPKRDGRRIHVVEGPSGDSLEARPVITRFIPSPEGAKTKLGPSPVR